MREIVHFYAVNDPYGEFSNFSPHKVMIDGKAWPTTEHYFQAQKFVGLPREEVIREARGPGQAARMGRSRDFPLRSDWEEVKDDIMRKAVLAKFTQHERLAQILRGTGDATLVEHTRNDSYWGDGGDGRGKNMLGKILMETRDIITP